MLTKGYAHPLYSLDIVQAGAQAPEPAYVIRAPEGLLYFSPSLRRLGEKYPAIACQQAVAQALPVRERWDAALAAAGLDAEWADNVRFWLAWMHERARRRSDQSTVVLTRARDGQAMRAQARLAWTRLGRAVRLAGMEPLLPRQRTRSEHGLLDGLQQVVRRLADGEVAGALARGGFTGEDQEGLAQLVAGLAGWHGRRPEETRVWRETSAELAVTRGALLGDLRRLSDAAKLRLAARDARPLEMGRLLPAMRRPAPAAAADGGAP